MADDKLATSATSGPGNTAGSVPEMSPVQREMARHALGFPNKKNTSNRNHYCIGEGGDGHDEWLDLVAKGLAIRRTGPHWGGDDMFHLTLKGALMVREPKEHLSREDAERMRAYGERPQSATDGAGTVVSPK